jgi:antitoxin YefM
MATKTTYSQARANLARLCNLVSENREVVYITRRSAEDVALISASELSSLLETAHLMRSPKNAQRLLTALNHAMAGKEPAQNLKEFKIDMGLE